MVGDGGVMIVRLLYRVYLLSVAVSAALLVGYGVYNTTLNDAYQIGATTWDSAEFASVIWRSGWTLKLPAVFGADASFFMFHSSPILLIPNAVSYVFPGDRISYYALSYAVLYALLMLAVFRLLRDAMPFFTGVLLAGLGALMLFAGQVMVNGSWEMRIDFAAPMFAILAFRAYQQRHYRMAAVWITFMASVREDMGVVFAIPLFLLACTQWVMQHYDERALARERLRCGIMLSILSVGLAALSYYVQTSLFHVFDQVNVSYYTLSDPFGHITEDLLTKRAWTIFYTKPGVWLPLAILLLASAFFRDAELLAGAIGFLPYLLAMFLAKMELAGLLESYKPFPLVVAMLWPAIVVLQKPRYMWRAYMLLQFLLLVAGLCYLSGPMVEALHARWTPMPLTQNAQVYRRFGDTVLKKENPKSGKLRASHGIISLYVDQFPLWWESNIAMMKPEDAGKVETIVWFDGDRDSIVVEDMLKRGSFELSMVPGTQIMIARRVHAPDAPPTDLSEMAVELLP